ncbi:hypothetical protein IIA94_02575, partial [Patescibacteria group bacterium]|nr:hypothetical protein [Patescibacteria group bacterium]
MQKRKLIILSIITLSVLIGTGGVLAINGYFGGGGSIPEDTFTLGLVGYWDFEEGNGIIAADSSGNGNDGTLTNMTEDDWVAANNPKTNTGGALEFDEVDDYVSIAVSSIFDITDAITLSAWAKRSSGGDNTIVSKRAKPGGTKLRNYQLKFLDTTSEIAFQYRDTGGTVHQWKTTDSFS